MKRILAVSLLALSVLTLATATEAARVRVVHRAPRTRVVVHTGFPLVRPLPHVYVPRPKNIPPIKTPLVGAFLVEIITAS